MAQQKGISSADWHSGSTLTLTTDRKHAPEFDKDFPLRLDLYEFHPTNQLAPNSHDYLELTYIFQGKGTFFVENKSYKVGRGDVMVVNNTEFHLLEAARDSDLKSVCVFFLPELIHEPGRSPVDFEYLRPFYYYGSNFVNRIPASSPVSTRILGLIERIYEELNGQNAYFRLAAKNALCEILLHVNRYCKNELGETNQLNRRSHDVKRIRPLFDLIESEYRQKLTTKMLAEAACMSSGYLCRFFKKTTGRTLSDYIMRYRLDKAKEMLVATDASVTNIAYQTGFESHSYFDRMFRRLTHTSPLQFRKRYGMTTP